MPHSAGKEISQWVEQARQGSSEAFEIIVGQLSKPLKGYLLTQIRGNEQACEELVQDTWIAVWQELERPADKGGYDPAKGGFYTYVIHRFAKYKALQWIDDRGRRPISLEPETDDTRSGLTRADPDAQPADDLLVAEEEALVRLKAYSEMFRLVFLCGGYPNQQLAFGFSKHILGKQSERAIEGAPEKVADEYGGVTLSLLLEAYWQRYQSESRIVQPEIESLLKESLSPLRKRLPVTVAKLMEKDKASLDQHRPLADRVVAKTCLKDYYQRRKGGHTAAIPDWCYKVEGRVRRVLELGPKACSRCKLRHLQPCVDRAGEDRAFAHQSA